MPKQWNFTLRYQDWWCASRSPYRGGKTEQVRNSWGSLTTEIETAEVMKQKSPGTADISDLAIISMHVPLKPIGLLCTQIPSPPLPSTFLHLSPVICPLNFTTIESLLSFLSVSSRNHNNNDSINVTSPSQQLLSTHIPSLSSSFSIYGHYPGDWQSQVHAVPWITGCCSNDHTQNY